MINLWKTSKGSSVGPVLVCSLMVTNSSLVMAIGGFPGNLASCFVGEVR